MASNSKKTSHSNQFKAEEALGKIRGLESQVAATLLEMQEKVQQLEQFNELSAFLNSTLDSAIVREKALEATSRLLRCEGAALFLIDRQNAELVFERGENQPSIRLPIDDRSLAGYVAMSGESVISNHVSEDFRPLGKTFGKQEQQIRTMVCVPLRVRERVLGVLQAVNKLPSVSARPSLHAWPDFHENDRKILQTMSHQVAIAVENSRLYTDLKKSFFDTVEALAEAIEKKDRYTGGHTKRVVYYSMCIAKHMDLTSEQLEQIRLAAILHDVGKIGIEDSILKKPAPLDADEWTVMRTHPDQGYDIMSRVEGLRDVIGGMRYHHERWDGKGYPFGLKGQEIPLIARVIAVADTYDALVSTRPYRKGVAPRKAVDEIVRNQGTQFDPEVVEAFLRAFRVEKMGMGSGGATMSNCD